MLDRLPPQARHLLLMLLASLLAWAGSDLVPMLQSRPGIGAILAPLLALFISWLTPLTRQYGVGVKEGEKSQLVSAADGPLPAPPTAPDTIASGVPLDDHHLYGPNA